MDSAVQVGNRHRLTTRERFGLLIHGIAALALVPAYLLLAPPSNWHPVGLIAVLSALAIVAIRHDVPLPSGIQFDATAALALISVALVGPLPALAVIFPPIAVNAICGRERLLRAGNLANLAAFGWYTLIGALLLELLGPLGGTVGVFFVVGTVQLFVNWAVGPAIYGTFWLGHPFRELVQMLRETFPTGTAMAALGAVTAVLYSSYGLLALALFALVAILPQTALTFVARTRPVARLDPLTAARRYGAAMAEHLGLDRSERRELDAVIRIAHVRDASGDPGEHLSHAVLDWSEASCAAGHVTEWWNGAGGPAGLPGGLIPLSSRIAAVARTWSALTADGSPRIGHSTPSSHLEAAAGVRLDPRVVKAAFAVVAQERLSTTEPAPEPRLHHLHVPPRAAPRARRRVARARYRRAGATGRVPPAATSRFPTSSRAAPAPPRVAGRGAARRSWGSSRGSRPGLGRRSATGSARRAPGWLALAVVLELLSCLSYVLMFKPVFCPRMSWRTSYELGMSELAVGSIVPASGAGGLALGAWALRKGGMPGEEIARRSVAFFVLKSAVNFVAVVVVGVVMWLGVGPDRSRAAHAAARRAGGARARRAAR